MLRSSPAVAASSLPDSRRRASTGTRLISTNLRVGPGEDSGDRRGWPGALWSAFLGSYDPDEFAATGGLVSTLLVIVGVVTCLALLGYFPPLARASGFRAPHLCLGLILAGAAVSALAYRLQRHRMAGALFTLLDNGFYSAGVSLAALSTHGGYAIGIAVFFVLAALAIPATVYSLTLLLVLVVWLPPVTLILWTSPPPEIAMIMLGGLFPFLLLAHQTGRRRRFKREHQPQTDPLKPEQARREESVQLALTRALLDVGHLLHELRNKQAAVDASLQVLARHTTGEGPAQAALQVAMAAEQDELRFVEHVLTQVKRETEREPRGFSLVELLESVASDSAGVSVRVAATEDCVAAGDQERLGWVLANLIRNARQAAATRVTLEVRVARERGRVELCVIDDGRGMPGGAWDRLFEPFATSSGFGGTGLGLYLCRRYLELMGGTLEALSSGGEGTTFRIILPLADLSKETVMAARCPDVA
jgi:signal transduction histidine kinase